MDLVEVRYLDGNVSSFRYDFSYEEREELSNNPNLVYFGFYFKNDELVVYDLNNSPIRDLKRELKLFELFK